MRKTTYSLLSIISAAVLALSFHASLSSGATPLASSTTSGTAQAGGSSGSTSSGSGVSSGSASTGTSSAGNSGSSTSSSSTGAGTPSSTSGTSGTSGGLKSGTFTGTQADTPYGPVQVQVTVAGGKISSAQAVLHPSGDGNSQQINAYAVPILNSEAVSAQSAQINMVSGATFTSDGYQTSLQSALDQAKS